MIAKKIIPAGDRRVTNAEFLDWVREAIERREAGMPGKGQEGPGLTSGASDVIPPDPGTSDADDGMAPRFRSF
jgi:hypothetical protein